jgi:hypothetical protein
MFPAELISFGLPRLKDEEKQKHFQGFAKDVPE